VGANINDLEREAVILNPAWSMIDEMVNWAMFVAVERTEPTNLMFQTRQCARLFLILLGDFLSDVRAFKGEPLPLGLKPAPSNAAVRLVELLGDPQEAFDALLHR